MDFPVNQFRELSSISAFLASKHKALDFIQGRVIAPMCSNSYTLLTVTCLDWVRRCACKFQELGIIIDSLVVVMLTVSPRSANSLSWRIGG